MIRRPSFTAIHIHAHGAWWKYTKASSCACVDEGLQSYAFAAGEACHRWHARRINWMRTNVRRRKLGRQGNDGHHHRRHSAVRIANLTVQKVITTMLGSPPRETMNRPPCKGEGVLCYIIQDHESPPCTNQKRRKDRRKEEIKECVKRSHTGTHNIIYYTVIPSTTHTRNEKAWITSQVRRQ